MTSSLPAPGTFLIPVGRLYWFCLQVVIVTESRRGTHWTLKRWGLNDSRTPCNDGRGHERFYAWNLKNVLPDVWKDEPELPWPHYHGGPIYYRAMRTAPQQRELF